METIKAVEMVRKIRDKQYEETKDMSNEELRLYFHKISLSVRKEVGDNVYKNHSPTPNN